MEWDTPSDEFEEELVRSSPLFNSFSLGLIESELDQSANFKKHHCYLMIPNTHIKKWISPTIRKFNDI